MSKSVPVRVDAVRFHRPESGAVFAPTDWPGTLPLSNQPGWQSNGGPHRGHPARSFPLSLEIPIPDAGAGLVRLQFLGIFALYAASAQESAGTLGASVQLLGNKEIEFRHDLLNGRHYRDAFNLEPQNLHPGDGTSLETVGLCEWQGQPVRVDLLTIDVPGKPLSDSIRFRDLGSPASFVIFDGFVEHLETAGCPFHRSGGGISLGEIAGIVRIGDRVRLSQSLDQLTESLVRAEDLDEARGQALTYLSMVTAATMEMGGSRSMHRVQLDAAREMDRLDDLQEIAQAARRWVEQVASSLLADHAAPSLRLVDRALQIVERNYAKDLSDESVAEQLGLSTSHFRFLFKQVTGQPFHKYLVALRLEKARAMLLEQEVPVSAVAQAVGFAGLSHFSRAFAQRFNVSPTSTRKTGAN
jgi:AraC-like DNA-binding protein